MRVIAGLGNPGAQYQHHRHNIGFKVLDCFAASSQQPVVWRNEFQGQTLRLKTPAWDALLIKPMSYMNRSGQPIQQALSYYKCDPEQLIVVHDELDLDFGMLRIKQGGGTAGHNGLKSIVQHCGPHFTRLRVGIGRPRAGGVVNNHVLNDFSRHEQSQLDDLIISCTQILNALLSEDVATVMNRFHTRAKP